jgi:hypothetical protein
MVDMFLLTILCHGISKGDIRHPGVAKVEEAADSRRSRVKL